HVVSGSPPARPARGAASELAGFDKLQSNRVHAVAQMRRLGTVVKDMAKVRVASRARHLYACHSQAIIGCGLDLALCDRGPEARPAGPGVEFRVRAEQVVAPANASVDSLFVQVPILPPARPLPPS